MGFSRELFISTPSAYLTCSICLDILQDPLNACNSGHTFCAECIKHAISVNNSCPNCRAAVTLTPNLPVRSIIAELEVRCITTVKQEQTPKEKAKRKRRKLENKESFCQWTGPLKNLANHEETCGNVNVRCKLGCSKTIARNEIGTHERHECMWRKVECKDCKKPVPKNSLDIHRSFKCDYRNVKCLFCDAEMTRKMLGQTGNREEFGKEQITGHYLLCEKYTVYCPIEGCNANYKLGEGEAHFKENILRHAALLNHSLDEKHNWDSVKINWQIENEKIPTGISGIYSRKEIKSSTRKHMLDFKLILNKRNDPIEIVIIGEKRKLLWDSDFIRIKNLEVEIRCKDYGVILAAYYHKEEIKLEKGKDYELRMELNSKHKIFIENDPKPIVIENEVVTRHHLESILHEDSYSNIQGDLDGFLCEAEHFCIDICFSVRKQIGEVIYCQDD